MAHGQSSEIPSTGRTRTLAIDVGGTGLKASIVDDAGRLLTDRARIDTPVGAPPKEIVQALVQLVQPLGAYDRVSVGFPGVVREGRVLTAPNLGNKGWKGFDLTGALGKALGKPVRVANDADVQGLAVIAGKGVEMVITLGTGFGTSLGRDLRRAARQRRPQGDRQEEVEQAGAPGHRQPPHADELRSPLHRRRQRQEDRLRAGPRRHHRGQLGRPGRRRGSLAGVTGASHAL